ncbi:MAG: D-alanine--poly(phosphoribitol) ligase subunit DltA [Desulfitobacteriaceae bacterium]
MLLQQIDAWADRYPNRWAHRHREQTLNYANLKVHSDALALGLHQLAEERHISRGTPLIIYGHKESEMLILFLACAKAGYPYIPVDSSLPLERLRQIIKISGAALLLSPQKVPSELKHPPAKQGQPDTIPFLLVFGEINWRKERCPFPEFLGQAPAEAWHIQSDEVFYIIYTSGSTGLPKGVQITLRALESFVRWVNSQYHPEEGAETFLNQAPFSFDLSVMDLYMSLSSGGTLWSVDKEQIANPKELFSSFLASDLTFWVSTPSFTEICLADRGFSQDLLPKLKRFLFCGEVLTHDCAQKLTERFPQAWVENLYGPTEATVAVTTLTITPEILRLFNPLPVGRVKADCQILIADTFELAETLAKTPKVLPQPPRTLPEGERGEIIIAGPSVSSGYLNNPEQNAHSFFSWTDGHTLWQAYRTGDAGSLSDGLLFYYGRLDFQIKLHGYRIELGDIEENLRRIPWVDNAIVLPVEKEGKVEYLHAFLTTSEPVDDGYHSNRKIRTALREFLPDYMIPRRFSFLTHLPMTPNGKVDRRALKEGLR